MRTDHAQFVGAVRELAHLQFVGAMRTDHAQFVGGVGELAHSLKGQ